MKSYKLTHIHVVSAGLIVGGISAVVALFLGLITLPFTGIGFNRTGFTGPLAVILVPLVEGILGFFGGLIGAFVFNVVADLIGGLEIKLEGNPADCSLSDYDDIVA